MKKQFSALNKLKFYSYFNDNKFLIAFVLVLVTVIFIGIFQDYLDSNRKNYPFFFSESLLFKSFWLIFPPILWLLKYLLRNRKFNTYGGMGVMLIASAVTHLVLTSLTVWCLSVIFRDQSYGIIKVLNYTLANDLIKIFLVYGIFIYGLKYVMNHNHQSESGTQLSDVQHSDLCSSNVKVSERQIPEAISSVKYLIVNSGKNNNLIKLSDILYIQSATPYVSIQMEDKEYLHSTTLKSMAEKLDFRFIRIHRSSIVNIEKVLSYQSRLNGDYDLTLDNGSEIRLSRNYVKAFKSRFESTPQLKT